MDDEGDMIMLSSEDALGERIEEAVEVLQKVRLDEESPPEGEATPHC